MNTETIHSKKLDRLKNEIKIAATTDYHLCEHCLHYIPCKEKECPQYIEGVGGTINGEYKDWKWDCTQFNFGECPLLENTPCYNCVQNDYKNFEIKF